MINRDYHPRLQARRAARRQSRLAVFVIALCLIALVLVLAVTLTGCDSAPKECANVHASVTAAPYPGQDPVPASFIINGKYVETQVSNAQAWALINGGTLTVCTDGSVQ